MNISPESTRLGWIGTGVMGRSMCSHLLKAGYPVAVYNRSAAKLTSLVNLGAVACSSPAEVAAKSDIVLSIVGYPQDVEQIYLGEEGILKTMKSGGVVVDMTTSKPSLAKQIASEAEAKGIQSLDAPVSGGDIGAREARLSIMVGGDQSTFESLAPIWKTLGTTYIHQGAAGSGQHTKMVNQILIASGMVGLCEAFLYAKKSGLHLETVLRSVAVGAAGSWALTNLTPRILKNDFAPGFFVNHLIKDLAIALEEAERMNLDLTALAHAKKVYEFLRSMNHGDSGTQALVLALAQLNHVEWSA